MTPILLRHAALAVVLAVVLATGVLTAVAGTDAGLGSAVGGVLGGVNFLGLTFIISRILDDRVAGGTKGALGLALVAKMGVVGFALWFALMRLELSALGVVFGLGAAIFGLTLGLARATASPEGRAAMAAEEARIVRELQAEREAAERALE